MDYLERHRVLAAVIDFFAWDMWAAYRAVAVHVPDQRGDCAGCHGRVRYPCVSASCAQRAIELST